MTGTGHRFLARSDYIVGLILASLHLVLCYWVFSSATEGSWSLPLRPSHFRLCLCVGSNRRQAIPEALGLRHIDYGMELFPLTWIKSGSLRDHFSATSIRVWM